jgi:hypothetical protein
MRMDLNYLVLTLLLTYLSLDVLFHISREVHTCKASLVYALLGGEPSLVGKGHLK